MPRLLLAWVLLIALGDGVPSVLAATPSGEVAGLVTQLNRADGNVEIKRNDAAEWHPVGPAQVLHPGDSLRVTGDASAVVVLAGGRVIRVDQSNPLVALPLPSTASLLLPKVRTLLEASIRFLAGQTRESAQGTLGSRGRPQSLVIVSPHNSLVLPDSLVFDWVGGRSVPARVRILKPDGVILERNAVVETHFDYPVGAPVLTPGVRYVFQVVSEGDAPGEAWFELTDAVRAKAIRTDLVQLEEALSPIPPSSLAVVQAGFLAQAGLVHDARLAILAALARDPNEAVLHVVLGDLYSVAGLPNLAAASYSKGRSLLREGSK
jgi:hypothetical protein